jgi:hypothetical protein
VAARSKTWTVFACVNTGIVDSNPTQGINICIVCVQSVFAVSYVQASALRPSDPLSKESTDCVQKDQGTEKAAKVQHRAVEPQIDRQTDRNWDYEL